MRRPSAGDWGIGRARDPPAGSLPGLRRRSPLGKWPGGARRQGEGPRTRLRRPCPLRAAGPGEMPGERRLRREGRAACYQEADTETVFAATIFDNRNDFQQPRLPVLTIRGLRNGACGLPRRPTWPVSRPAAYTLTQSSDAIGEGSIGFGQATRAKGRDRK